MKKALIGLALVSAGALAVWNLRGGGDDVAPTSPADDKLVVDRVWIDHMPRTERDVFQIFVAITEQPFGVFQAQSQWKGQFEFFRYEASSGELRIFYGQTGEKEKVKTKASKCTEKGMDFCLQLDGASRGVKKYYSMEGWEIDGATSIEQVRERIKSMIVPTQSGESTESDE